MLGALGDALTLLTRLRLRPREPGVWVGAWFPVAGALVGLVVGGALVGASLVLPVGVSALVAVAVEVWLTGALHLDGLADCADGSAGRDPEHRLAIMKDHAVGVYGTVAVVLALGLRVLALSALAAGDRPGGVVAGVVGAWTLSRTAMLLPAFVLPYARAAGTGRSVVTGLTGRVVAVGVLLALILLCGLSYAAGTPVAWARAGGAVLAVLVTSALVTGWARARLGGATGDVLGATAEAGLAAALVALLL